MKEGSLFVIVIFLLFYGIIGCQLPDTGSGRVGPIAQESRHFPATLWPDRIMHSASADPATEVRISWRTNDEISSGFIEFIENTGGVDFVEKATTKPAVLVPVYFDGFKDHYFQVVLKGLMPSKTYLLRVGDEEFRSEWFVVKTTSKNFELFTFLYFGDVQNEIREFGSRVFQQAEYQFPDAAFMVHAGDLVLSSGDDDTWGEWFFSGGRLFQRVPSIAVAGNSDHNRWKSEPVDSRLLFPQWHGVFNQPDNGLDELRNLSYYVDYPELRVVSFYSNFVSIRDNRDIYVSEEIKLDSAIFFDQVNWLEEVLADNDKQWLVLVLHHPVFSGRENRTNAFIQESLLPLLEKYDIDLVLQGHDHVYARGTNPSASDKSQLPVFMINMSGGKMAKGNPDQNWIYSFLENKQLFSAVEVNAEFLRVRTFDTTGKLWDDFRIEYNELGKHLLESDKNYLVR